MTVLLWLANVLLLLWARLCQRCCRDRRVTQTIADIDGADGPTNRKERENKYELAIIFGGKRIIGDPGD